MQDAPMQHPINHKTLYELEETVAGGIPEIIVDLIDTFVNDGQETLGKLTTALRSGHLKQVELHAHSLKSSSATFGAEALATLFAQMEHLARTGSAAKIEALVTETQAKFVDVAHALQEERSRLLHM